MDPQKRSERGSIEDLTEALLKKKRKGEEEQQRVRERRRRLNEKEELNKIDLQDYKQTE